MHNKKMAVPDGTGNFKLRVFHRASQSKRDPRYLLKCGCCEESVEIYYGGGSLEINGVNASITEWEKILLPLFKNKNKGV